jgi:hypothetical protein
MSNNTKKIPPIVQAGAWLLSLIVFVVGFWHTHLGLKEMKPFGSEKGGLAIAAIVLLLILITYWFAVNGKKIALVFYILCGLVFFVCNLNYFYPSYMARTLIKEEASALKDTIDSYSTKMSSSSNELKKSNNYAKLITAKNEIIFQLKSNHGFGEKATNALNVFNDISGNYNPPPNDVDLDEKTIQDWEKKLNDLVTSWVETNSKKEGIKSFEKYMSGKNTLDSLQKNMVPELKKIATDDNPIALDSVMTHPHVKIIKDVVESINSSAININESAGKEIIKPLSKDIYPNADKLGRIQNTLSTIGKRLNQISTWAIIILCLFIDLIVPLAIYTLLRKKEDEPEEKNKAGRLSPSSF